MRVDQLPGEFIGANIQTTPALSIGDKACDGHRTLKQYGKLIAFLNVFPVTRVCTANLFRGIKFVGVLQLFVGIGHDAFFLNLGVFGAFLSRMIALGTKAPSVSLSELVAGLIKKIDVVSLLNRFASETGIVLNKIF